MPQDLSISLTEVVKRYSITETRTNDGMPYQALVHRLDSIQRGHPELSLAEVEWIEFLWRFGHLQCEHIDRRSKMRLRPRL